MLTVFMSGCFQKSLPIAEDNTSLAWAKRKQMLATLRTWTIKGKAAFFSSNDSGSATFTWQQTNDQFEFMAFDPLGNEAFQLNGGAGETTLQLANGKRYTGTESDALFRETLNIAIPLSSLTYWIKGLPDPHLPINATFDQSHRISQMQQGNWQVIFHNYTPTKLGDLPRFITMQSGQYKTKVMIYNWDIPST
jgi:outer membrane lipoprotein LolB